MAGRRPHLRPAGRTWDLVTTRFLHPPDGGMGEVARLLAGAVASGGQLLAVGHAPSEVFAQLRESHHRAMLVAADLVDHLPEGLRGPRRRAATAFGGPDGVTVDIEDSTLLARRA